MNPAEHPSQRTDRPAGPPNPFESYLLVICIIQGASVLFGYARPLSIEVLLPGWLRLVWAFLLLAGGVSAVVGLFWRGDPVDAIIIKRTGLIGAAGATLAYGVALINLGGPGFVAAAFNLGFAAACVVRSWQVTRALREFRGTMQAIRDVAINPVGVDDRPPGAS